MRTFIVAILMGIALAAVSQQSTPKFEAATVTSVEENKNPAMKEDGTDRQYKVGLRTATREYVVLYTPAYGSRSVEYGVGSQVSILVLKKTVRFSDVGGKTADMPIISSRKIELKKPE
ncbi:MAG: hypothetical protein ROO76_13075 [Terriglobia bacterium]|nr:hypothetical protein [Terriglobia bacterium]